MCVSLCAELALPSFLWPRVVTAHNSSGGCVSSSKRVRFASCVSSCTV